ncbi:M1 family metallopeptidase [Algibacter aquimarinus]|uniref:Aminopeptidase N n=1 Tax=Algibacter aquimarinus TaxID=1136748 RepID=A0ABP9HNG5_9FLAO
MFLIISFLGFSQQTEYVDFKTADIKINIAPKHRLISGSAKYTFTILKDIDSVYLDAKSFSHIEGLLEDQIYHDYDGKHFILKKAFKKGSTFSLNLDFTTNPKKALYFVEKGEKPQIWTQGQGKYTSNWLPSIDDMNDKIEFDLSITFDKSYEVIANGQLKDKKTNDSATTWHYDMKEPMSSYLVALAIGKYNKKVEYSKSGIPIEMYYYPEDSLKVEPTYRYTKQIFDFLEEEIGVSYPWQNYKQVPVKDFLYAGMENTGTTIFADSFVIDSIAFVDKNYVNVNAHELAHQWFGNLVTETSGTHHWLQEGFATYYALLAERDIFGDDYYYWRLYEYAQELIEQDKAGGTTSLLNPKSSSTTFYKKGAWVLHMLREKVGDKAFKKGVKNYLEKYQFKNVETDDFVSEVEKVSRRDLTEFFRVWLESESVNYDAMEEMLYLNSMSIKQYLQYNCKDTPELCKSFLLEQKDSFYKARIVESLGNKISKSTFLTQDIKVRQAIAKTLSEIPVELKDDYESLLNDKSYITIEAALFNLWKNFPEERQTYFDQTKGIIGLNDKNVRILWLTLNLVSPDFEDKNIRNYYQELIDYTSSKYGFEVRQKAFFHLQQIQACNDVCKEHLKQATKHHSWQFSKFAKSMLKVIED